MPHKTFIRFRPNAPRPWLIKQGHNEVKLYYHQLHKIIMALMDGYESEPEVDVS